MERSVKFVWKKMHSARMVGADAPIVTIAFVVRVMKGFVEPVDRIQYMITVRPGVHIRIG